MKILFGAGILLFGIGMSQVSFQLLKNGEIVMAYICLFLFNAAGIVGFGAIIYKQIKGV